MNLLDGLIGGIRAIYQNGTEMAFRHGLDLVDFAITVGADRLHVVVAGLREVPVSDTPPTTGQVLAYDGTEWAPASLGVTLPIPEGDRPAYEYTSGMIDADLADVLTILHGLGIINVTVLPAA